MRARATTERQQITLSCLHLAAFDKKLPPTSCDDESGVMWSRSLSSLEYPDIHSSLANNRWIIPARYDRTVMTTWRHVIYQRVVVLTELLPQRALVQSRASHVSAQHLTFVRPNTFESH